MPTELSAPTLDAAMALHRSGRLAEAEAAYREILARQPDNVECHRRLSSIAFTHADYPRALHHIDAALAQVPDDAELHNNRAATLIELNQLEDAIASCTRAITLDPASATAFNNRGAALRERERFEEALADYARATALKPDFAEAFSNTGIVLHELGRFMEALACYDRALALEPDDAIALFNRGITLGALGRFDEELASYSRAQAIAPNFINAHLNEAFCRLSIGDFERGWEKYEWRWRTPRGQRTRRTHAQPEWNGRDHIAGKTVLLYAEQGFGDTIQFSRYVAMIAARGARIILEVQPQLKRLLSNLAGADTVLGYGEPSPPFDLHFPLLSLPRVLGTRLDTIPPLTKPLSAPRDLIQQWEKRLGQKHGPRVGIVWSGYPHPANRNDRKRSLPLQNILALRDQRFSFVSLQKEITPGDRELLAARGPEITHFGTELIDFAETAALASLMDVVVSIDTAVAHLAASLARPTVILLPFAPDWRWLHKREDSPWYPTARLVRQSRPGDWDWVLERVTGDLRRMSL
jgi:tetratricopeptide (TPR) repeat protein